MPSKQATKTAAQIRAMRRVQADKMEDYLTEWGFDFCRGCGTNKQPIDWSHHLRQGLRPDLRDDPRNMERMCRAKCHPAVESGNFEGLINGAEIRAYIEEHEERLLHIKPR
jgi:hypothetical protein